MASVWVNVGLHSLQHLNFIPLSTILPVISHPPPPPHPTLMSSYGKKYGILKFKINFKWLYSFSLFPVKAPCSSNNKEETQRKEVLAASGKSCTIVKSMNNK